MTLQRLHASTLLLVMAFCGAATLSAQSDDDASQPEKTTPYSGTFGIGGGISPHWLFLGTNALNSALAAKNLPTVSGGGMLLLGGHGYAYIMIVPNLRVGGMGAGGSLSVERTEPDPSTSSQSPWFDRTTLGTGFGGVTIEYVFPFKRLQIAIGGLLGAGAHSLTLTHMRAGERSWAPPFDTQEYQHTYSSSFFAYQPGISIEYLVSPFTLVGVTGGYYGTWGTTWKMDDEFIVTDMPDIRFAGAFVRLGITFGLFIPE